MNNKTFLLFLLIILGIFLRFYNLNWGNPFYFHPDERNITSSVIQLSFPKQLNPQFFAYGSLPIYLIYFVNLFLSLFLNFELSSANALLIGRSLSALFSVSMIPLSFLVGKNLKNSRVGLFFAFLTTTSVGFIQFAHFGTFEIWLAFGSLLLFYLCLRIMETNLFQDYFLASLLVGLLISIKISGLIFWPLPILAVILYFASRKNQKGKFWPDFFIFISFRVLILSLSSLLVFLLTSPFSFLDFSSFVASIKYESGVALGTLPVFYTSGFPNTTPFLFQLTKIYPFLLNPLLTLFFIPSIIYLVSLSFKKKNRFYFLLSTFYFLLFLSQVFFLAKWTRYMLPTLPFVYLMIALFVEELTCYLRNNFLIKIGYFFIFAFCLVFSFSYLMTTFASQDSRIAAATWSKEHLSQEVKVLSEVYDLGIVPFNQYFSKITLFDFYELDLNPQKEKELSLSIEKTDLLILPSQRLIRSRLLNPEKFPKGYLFYKNLLGEKSGFKKIYKTPCDFFCKIIYLGDPVFFFEETVNVFDRPTVFIFKKVKNG